MNKQQKLEAIYKEIANKEFTTWCKFIGRYWYLEHQTYPHTLSRIEKQFVQVKEFPFYSYEDTVTLVFPNHSWEFFYMWPVLHEKMFSRLRKRNNHGNFCKFHTVEEIIGHPVMLWDVLDWLEKNKEIDDKRFEQALSGVYNSWKHKRLPIDDQPEETIDYIYNLLQ